MLYPLSYVSVSDQSLLPVNTKPRLISTDNTGQYLKAKASIMYIPNQLHVVPEPSVVFHIFVRTTIGIDIWDLRSILFGLIHKGHIGDHRENKKVIIGKNISPQ